MEAFTELQTIVLTWPAEPQAREMSYDFVIVGGGSAGCVLANRLSADPATRVLVLEAGRPDCAWDVFIHMPAALAFPIGSRFYDWMYGSEPEPFMHGRRVYHARGKVLGGSSSDQRHDLPARQPARLRALGGRPRDGELGLRALPAVLQADGDLPRRRRRRTGAADGPLVLERGPATSPLFGAFFEAVQQAGYPLTDDVNGYRQEGFARVRPQHPPRPPAERGAGLPPPGDAPRRTSRSRTRALVTRVLFEGSARGRRRDRVAGRAAPSVRAPAR